MYRILILSMLLLCLIPQESPAILGLGDLVSDPITEAQTTLTAARTLLSNANEATQLSNQAQQLVNEAKNLVSLPMSYVQQIQSTIQSYYDVLQQGQMLSYQINSAVHQFDSLYRSGFNGDASMMQRAQQLLGAIRETGRIASQAQALYERLCATQATTGLLLQASQAAPGSLAAQQAGNQLLGVMIEQNGALQQLQATSGRLQMGVIMREVTAEERAQWNAQQFISGYGEGTFRGPKEGKGQPLPQ